MNKWVLRSGFCVLGSGFWVQGSGFRVECLGFFAFSETDGEIDDRADKRNQGNKPPHRLFSDTAEIFPCDIDDGPAGGKIENNADSDDYGCIAQAEPFSSFEILNIAFT